MLVVETIAKVRRLFFRDRKGIKEISRDLNLSRNTVRKIIRSDQTEHLYTRTTQPFPQLGTFLSRLDDLLTENFERDKRQRVTVRHIYEILVSEGYSGGYDSVQRYAMKWRRDHGFQNSKVFIPLSFKPGEAYQFDWSYEDVILGGVVQKVKVAHFRLCHSRKFFVVAYPRESMEMLFDAHNRAFKFFGGTCNRGIYDNMATAVKRVLRGKEREFNKRFLQMCSHYLVEPVACTPAAGWEKGQVERQVSDIRKTFFRPRPCFADFDELNEWLVDRCRALAAKRKHPEDKNRTIDEVFVEEQASLVPINTPFSGYSEHECRVSSTSLVRYDRNHYSVACHAAGKGVTIRATATTITVFYEGEVVADHQRRFGRDKTIYNPWHYLDALQRKPGALRNGAPFQDWQLPRSLRLIQKRMMQHLGGDRSFVEILCAANRYGLDAADAACRKALSQGTTQSEVILNLIAREKEPAVPATISTPKKLVLHEEPTADCARYDRLRKGGESCSATN